MNFKNLKAPQQFPRIPYPEGNPSINLRLGKMGINWDGGNTGSGYEPEYQAILDYALVAGFELPSLANQAEQNQLVIDLKAAGVWDELDSFYCFAGDGDEAFALIDWKRKAAGKAVNPRGTNTGAQYIPNVGFKGNGVDAYINTGLLPQDGFASSAQNIATFGDIKDVGSFDQALWGTLSTLGYSQVYVVSPYLAFSTSLNSTGVAIKTPDLVDLNKFVFNQRVDASQVKIWTDGVLQVTGSLVYTSEDYDQPMHILCRYFNGLQLFSDATISCWGQSTGLVGKELALYNAWNTYKTKVQQDLEYQEILEYADVIGAAHPSAPVQSLQKQLINDLKAAGVWDELDSFYCFAGDGDELFALIDWKRKGVARAVNPKGTNTGAQYIVNQGFKGNGVDAYINTGFIPSQGSKHTVNDSGLFLDGFGASPPVSTKRLLGASSGDVATSLYYEQSGGSGAFLNTMSLGINSNGGVRAANNSGLVNGFLHAQKIGDTSLTANLKLFINGGADVITQGALNPAYNELPTNPIYLLTTTALNLFGDWTIACFGAGSSLAGKELALYNAWTTYKTSL